jgi:hypothetical protein
MRFLRVFLCALLGAAIGILVAFMHFNNWVDEHPQNAPRNAGMASWAPVVAMILFPGYTIAGLSAGVALGVFWSERRRDRITPTDDSLPDSVLSR